MSNALEKIQRGYDTSSRPLYATRQSFQRYDRINEHLGGVLVIIQGSFNKGTVASAGTHDLAGAMDFRTWNLTNDLLYSGVRFGRDLGGADYIRTTAEGFDPHWHGVTIGDAPMSPETAQQVRDYYAGLNALASRRADTFSYRPANIQPYKYIEDDMFTDDDSARLKRIESRLDLFADSEKNRDQEERQRDKDRFTQIISALGGTVDSLAKIESRSQDPATKADIKKAKERILTYLKNHPDVNGVDNPSDDAMAAENLG
jgi:hypothetical protein